MPHIVEMPKLSDTMEEGGIAHWLKKEGEPVKVGDPLVEIETDKATQEYEAPEDGFLIKILVPEGKTVTLRTPIAVIGEKGETFDPSTLASKTQGAPDAKPQGGSVGQAAKPSVAAPASLSGGPLSTGTAQVPAPKPAPQGHQAPPASGGSGASGRIKSSPLARKMAQELGVDLGSISGSGPGGRVVVRDLPAPGSVPADAGGSLLARVNAPVVQGSAMTEMPVTMMRKTIAKRLVAAKNDAPHFYLKVSADVGELLRWRQRINEQNKDAKSVKVSVNDMISLAVSRALLVHPMVNASWQQETIVLHHQVHLALAVALPNGLVTPVIRNAHVLGVRALAEQAQSLVAQARDGKLANDAYAGGTFSISNLGMFGIEEFTAIINPPQSAILAVGAAMPTPWVNNKGEVVVSQRLKLTLSCDHRVVDGATGAQFLKTLVSYLEDPLQILL